VEIVPLNTVIPLHNRNETFNGKEGIAEFAGLENDGPENDGVEQEQTYAFKVIRVLFACT